MAEYLKKKWKEAGTPTRVLRGLARRGLGAAFPPQADPPVAETLRVFEKSKRPDSKRATIAALALVLGLSYVLVRAAIEEAGPNGPGAAANGSSIGTVSWQYVTDVTSGPGGNDRARANLPGNGGTSYYIVATNFGFNIAANRIILGILVEVQKQGQVTNIQDAAVRIVKDGVIGSTDKSAGAWPDTESFTGYGASNDLWALAWEPADINAAGFGMAFAAVNTRDNPGIRFAYVNYIRITVYHKSLDEDLDGMLDSYEVFVGLDPTTNDASLNYDSDDLLNSNEFLIWTDPFVADTDRDGFNDDSDSNATSRAFIDWGNPFYTTSNNYDYPAPDWWLDAEKSGGTWNTNAPSHWHVDASDTNACYLFIDIIDRTLLTNDLRHELLFYDHTNASLYVDLLDTNDIEVADNILGNLLAGTDTTVTTNMNIPLETYTNATSIVLRRGSGQITIYQSLLYIDKDNDGLDADQEKQLGTSDNHTDSDNDGLSDYQEVFTHNTDPTNADTDGDGVSDGLEVNLYGTNPLVQNISPHCYFVENFEINTVTLGDLNAQNGWNVTRADTALVVSNNTCQGDQALSVIQGTNTTLISRPFTNTAATVLWVDLWMDSSSAQVDHPPAVSGAAAQFYFNRYGQMVVYDGTSGWSVLDHDPVTGWVRVSFKCDYDLQEWLICLNGICVVRDLDFGAYNARPTEFGIRGGNGAVDAIYVGSYYVPDIDMDNDGLHNSNEVALGTDMYDPDCDNDGMSDGDEHYYGLPPLTSNSFVRVDTGQGTWTCGFETGEGYSLGDLDGQALWTGRNGTAVLNTDARTGQWSVDLPSGGGEATNAGIMQVRIGAEGREQIWAVAHLKPADGVRITLDHGRSLIMDIAGDKVQVYDGSLQQTVESTRAFQTGNQDWHSVHILLDYKNDTFTVCLDRMLAFEDVPFAQGTAIALSELRIRGAASSAVGVDDIQITTNDLFGGLDYDGDGLSNAAEVALGTDFRDVDTDSDGMDDKWEYDNNTLPLTASGAQDPDNDGVENLLEYQAGGNPQVVDTDSDGMDDYVEIVYAFSDPNTADFDGTVTDIDLVYGNDTTNWLGSWTREGTVIYARERSGYVEYTVTAPSNENYALEVEVTQHNPLTSKQSFDLSVYVDGTFSGRELVQAPYGTDTAATFFLPTVSAGDHTARIVWKNLEPNTFLQINKVTLQLYGGLDNNTNGISDWVENRLDYMSGLDTPEATSLVSPVCLEGESYYHDMLSVSASYVPEGSTQQVITVEHGIDVDWYANVLLSPTNDTVVQVADHNGSVTYSNTVTWTELNVLQPATYTNAYTNAVMVRDDDSFLLTAYPVGVTNGTVTVDVYDSATNLVTNVVTDINTPYAHLFDEAGQFTVTGTYANDAINTNASLSMEVIGCAFNGDPVCVASESRTWDCPDISAEAVIEYDDDLDVSWQDLGSGGLRFTLLNNYDTAFYMLARLPALSSAEGGEDGPIMANARVSSVYGDNGSYWKVVQNYADGSRMVEVKLQLGYVPSDIEVQLHIFVGGVLFLDGTIDKTLTASNFNELGVATYYFIQAADVTASICHTTEIYQGTEYIGGN